MNIYTLMLVLYLCVDPELYQYYKIKVLEHNTFETNPYPNSGFDIACPESVVVTSETNTFKLDFKVKAAMYIVPPGSNCNDNCNDNLKVFKPCGYYLYPRSSIAKTSFRLSNSVGIIDSGYRGNLCAYFDVMPGNNVNIEPLQRLTQICSPSLEPFYVILVDSLNNTERGENGFGSTGV